LGGMGALGGLGGMGALGGLGGMGALGGLGGLGGGGSGIMGSLGGFAGSAMGGIGLGFAGLEGMAFNMKKQMRASAQAFGDQMLIGMINNPGIPIEDMIFMFMAHMGDKYEQKLRDKMEEAARAEKRSTEREREQDRVRFLGGIVSAAGGGLLGLIPGVAMAAQGAGMAIQMAGQGRIMMKDALAGHTKSSTMLMQEVQMLTHKWKQINELMSNLLKTLHDMAMTPIRNMR
ncbi:MAG: hypothetical protein V3T05_01735, partial [Myxococcota bacterium]